MDIEEVPVILDADKLDIGKTVELLKTHDERTDEGVEKKYQEGKDERQDEKIRRYFLRADTPMFGALFHPAFLWPTGTNPVDGH
jgi:hypothetical protein